MKLLDLFCGRFGWSRAFAARGWQCVGVDLTTPPEIPNGCEFVQADVLTITADWIKTQGFDFICASSPCEQFSVHGMRHFHPNPPYPELGLKLFNHTRAICEAAGLLHVMENVRAAQQFVGNAVHHCGPFYLWGNAVPPLLNMGIRKGRRLMTGGYKGQTSANSDKGAAAIVATIPPELANTVAEYAERICEGLNLRETLTDSTQDRAGEEAGHSASEAGPRTTSQDGCGQGVRRWAGSVQRENTGWQR